MVEYIKRKRKSRTARKRQRQRKEKIIGYFMGILLAVQAFLLKPFMPSIKRIRRVRRLVKGLMFTKKAGFKLLNLAATGYSAYCFYDDVLKDKLNKSDDAVETA